MGRTVTYAIELLVGLACLALALPAWRRGGWMQAAGAVFGVAGVAAATHAIAQLV